MEEVYKDEVEEHSNDDEELEGVIGERINCVIQRMLIGPRQS